MKKTFIEKAIEKFGNKFDYSKVNYVNGQTPVIIICPIHGEFEVKPTLFLQSKYGCRKCATIEGHKLQTKSPEQFIEECKKVWGDNYNYEKTVYINSEEKVIITCPIHGDFSVRPADFLRKHGCPKCKGNKQSLKNKEMFSDSKELFIEKAKKVHGDKYDYSIIKYVDSRTKIDIICPKHGIFSQYPNHHLQGNGCPHCNKSHGENIVKNILDELNIEYTQQYRISDNDRNYYIDFCIKLNDRVCFIEFHGGQHYFPVEIFGGQEQFIKQVIRDYEIRDYCFDNNIKLLELKYDLDSDKIQTKILKLLNEIKNRT